MEFAIGKTNKTRDILLIFLVVLVVLLFRRLDAFTNPQLWAEDYLIYFLQFENLGIKSMIVPYGGYLHFVPRLVALFFGTLRVNYLYIPVCYSVSEFFITLFIALNIWKTVSYLNIKHKIVYATAFLFLPVASDIFMNLTNINWITSLYLINFLFIRYTDYTDKNKYLNLIAIFIISLSGPFSTFLSPVIVLVIISERKKLSFQKFIPLGLILMGGIIQFIYIAFIDPNFYRGQPGPPEHFHLLRLITSNMSEMLFLKGHFTHWLSPFKMTLISIFMFVVFLYNFIVHYFKITDKRRYILLLYAIIMFGAYIKTYWPNESKVLALDNARYYFVPFICIMWLMILSFDKQIKPVHIVLYLLFFVGQHDHITMRLPDKHWKEQILEYYQGKRQDIEINPEGWHYVMPPGK
jgi:hypothetical protein